MSKSTRLNVIFNAKDAIENPNEDYVELYVTPNHRLLSLFAYDSDTQEMCGYNLRMKSGANLEDFTSLLSQKVNNARGYLVDDIANIVSDDEIAKYVESLGRIDVDAE